METSLDQRLHFPTPLISIVNCYWLDFDKMKAMASASPWQGKETVIQNYKRICAGWRANDRFILHANTDTKKHQKRKLTLETPHASFELPKAKRTRQRSPDLRPDFREARLVTLRRNFHSREFYTQGLPVATHLYGYKETASVSETRKSFSVFANAPLELTNEVRVSPSNNRIILVAIFFNPASMQNSHS